MAKRKTKSYPNPFAGGCASGGPAGSDGTDVAKELGIHVGPDLQLAYPFNKLSKGQFTVRRHELPRRQGDGRGPKLEKGDRHLKQERGLPKKATAYFRTDSQGTS